MVIQLPFSIDNAFRSSSYNLYALYAEAADLTLGPKFGVLPKFLVLLDNREFPYFLPVA